MQAILEVDDSKLAVARRRFWAKEEEPEVAIETDYKYKKKGNRKGLLVLTRGALYVFKVKIEKSEHPVVVVCPLDVHKITYQKHEMAIESPDEPTLTVKSEWAGSIAERLVMFWREATYGVREVRQLELAGNFGDLALYEVQRRPRSALKHRALMLAHHIYKKKCAAGVRNTFRYFDKYDMKPKQTMIIGGSCHMDAYPLAFAQAIAWESRAMSMCLQGVMVPDMGKFLEVVMTHSQKISKVTLLRYDNKKISSFNMGRVAKTRVNEWSFSKVSKEQVFEFLQGASGLPMSCFNTVTIQDLSFSDSDIKRIETMAPACPALNAMKQLSLRGTTHDQISVSNIGRLVCGIEQLREVCFMALDMDGSKVLQHICSAKESIVSVLLAQMRFLDTLPSDMRIPLHLKRLSVMASGVQTNCLKSILEWITSKPVDIPIILELQNIAPQSTGDRLVYDWCHVYLQGCYPNICEFHFCGNYLPNLAILPFFAFCFTQKRLRMLSLSRCKTDNQQLLLRSLLELGIALPLYGLEMVKSTFNASLMVQFIRALAATTTTLRRAVFSESFLGDEGLQAMADLVRANPDLAEVGADGFHPRSSAVLFNFWKLVAENQSIKGNDFPLDDLSYLRLESKDLPNDVNTMLNSLFGRPQLTTIGTRLAWMLNRIEAHETPDFSPRIFGLAAPLHQELSPERPKKVKTRDSMDPNASEITEDD